MYLGNGSHTVSCYVVFLAGTEVGAYLLLLPYISLFKKRRRRFTPPPYKVYKMYMEYIFYSLKIYALPTVLYAMTRILLETFFVKISEV